MNLIRISKRIGLGDTEEFHGQSSLESIIKSDSFAQSCSDDIISNNLIIVIHLNKRTKLVDI